MGIVCRMMLHLLFEIEDILSQLVYICRYELIEPDSNNDPKVAPSTMSRTTMARSGASELEEGEEEQAVEEGGGDENEAVLYWTDKGSKHSVVNIWKVCVRICILVVLLATKAFSPQWLAFGRCVRKNIPL